MLITQHSKLLIFRQNLAQMSLRLFPIPQPHPWFVLSWCSRITLRFPLINNTSARLYFLILESVSPETASKAGSVLFIFSFQAPEEPLNQNIGT